MRFQNILTFVLLVGVIQGHLLHVKSRRRKIHRKKRNDNQTFADAIDAMFPTDAIFRSKLDHWHEADLTDEEPHSSNMKDAAKSIGYGSYEPEVNYGSRGRSNSSVPGGHYSGVSYSSVTPPPVYSYGSDLLGTDQYSGKLSN